MRQIKDELKYQKSELEEELRESYEEALKEPSFSDLVLQLTLSQRELMKYTSSLEECAEEYVNCKNCKSILECKNKMRGYAYLPTMNENNLSFEYQACKYKKELDGKVAYKKNMQTFEIPDELLNASMKDIDTTDKNRYPAIKWLQSFLKNYGASQKGLYLYGNYGSGKSFFIAAMFAELARKNIKSALVFWPEFLRDLKASFGTDFKEKYEAVKKVPLLLIDDIGAEVTTEWGRDEILCPLLQYRMDAKLPTFFTSNLDMKLLEEHFSCGKKSIDVVKAGRIISRIEQLTDQIEMVSINRR